MPEKPARTKKPVAPVQPPPTQPRPQEEVRAIPTPPSSAQQTIRDIIYPKLEQDEYSSISPKGPVDPEWCKAVLDWETEEEFKERKCREEPGSKPSNWKYDDDFHCKDMHGNKVRCRNNAQNRPFDMSWCEEIRDMILQGQWAGPFTIKGVETVRYVGEEPCTMPDGTILNPGDTYDDLVASVNGETIRISKFGMVLSGQHQMTAVILADEKLAIDRENKVDTPDKPKYPMWTGQDHVFIETIVVKGMSEDPRVLMTVDYNKPRSAADVFYTSPVFGSCTAPERKEMCRMLAGGVDFLWTRTLTMGYKTHPEVVAFLERHKRLLKCVEHIFEENKTREGKGRGISKLRLSPGTCSALQFIMGSSGPKTDGDVYRNETPAPSEKNLDWSLWEKAESFFTLLGHSKDFVQVRTALHNLVDSEVFSEDNQGMGGRTDEKLAILCEAWGRWKDHPDTSIAGPPFDDHDLTQGQILCLIYTDKDDKGNQLPEGQIKLVNKADFEGIDCAMTVGKSEGRKKEAIAPAPTPEEIERAAEEARARRPQAVR